MNDIPTTPIENARRTWPKAWLVLFVVLITAIGLFYAEENYRHTAAWRAHAARVGLDAHPLNFRDFLPKPVPEDQNFAATPVLKRIGIKGRSDEVFKKELQTYAAATSIADITKGTRADLEGALAFLEKNHGSAGAKQVNVGLDVLEAMKDVAPMVNELRIASQRTHAQFECDGEDPWSLPLPDFVAMRTLAQILSIRISAFLESGQPGEAMQDMVVLHRLMEAMKSNNTLVTAMVRVAVGGIEAGCFWEGWSRHAWRKADYEQFQKYYEALNYVEGIHKAFQGGERAGVHYLALNYPASKLAEVFSGGHTPAKSLKDALFSRMYELGLLLAPSGWRLAALQRYDIVMVEALAAMDPPNRRMDLVASRAVTDRVIASTESRQPLNLLVNVAIPNFSKALTSAARKQTFVHLSTIVCALERFKMEQGAYPKTLNSLIPGYLSKLPGEVASTGMFHYASEATGRFTLYSIGADGKDDGGTPGSSDENGDWPWMAVE